MSRSLPKRIRFTPQSHRDEILVIARARGRTCLLYRRACKNFEHYSGHGSNRVGIEVTGCVAAEDQGGWPVTRDSAMVIGRPKTALELRAEEEAE